MEGAAPGWLGGTRVTPHCRGQNAHDPARQAGIGAAHASRIDNAQLPKLNRGGRAIFGEDSRVEEAAVGEGWRAVGRSTVMLTRPAMIGGVSGPHSWSYAPPLSTRYPCPSPLRFASQRTFGFCSGTLIAADLVATAGHCLPDAADCGNTAVVFNATQATAVAGGAIPPSTVYFCTAILRTTYAHGQDWAVFKIDRPVPSSVADPVAVASTQLPVGAPLMMIGHPDGLPRKYSADASVLSIFRSNSPGLAYGTDLDAFGGNSGSGVFIAGGPCFPNYVLVGILSSGFANYASNDCPYVYKQGVVGEIVSGSINLVPNATHPTAVVALGVGGGVANSCAPTVAPPPQPADTAPPTPSAAVGSALSGSAAFFAVVEGSTGGVADNSTCVTVGDGACVTDGLGEGYATAERCTITVLRDTVVTSTFFQTEHGFDYLEVDGRRYSGDDGPQRHTVRAGGRIRWHSDHSITDGGWTFCGETPSPTTNPTPAPSVAPSAPTATGPVFIVLESQPTSTACFTTTQSTCITVGANGYSNSERCTIQILREVLLTASRFETQACCDTLRIGAANFSGTAGPDALFVSAGELVRWATDGSGTEQGWTICGSPAPPPTATPTSWAPSTVAPTASLQPVTFAPTTVSPTLAGAVGAPTTVAPTGKQALPSYPPTTVGPTAAVSPMPTHEPTAIPTSAAPTAAPTATPSEQPSRAPTSPTASPTVALGDPSQMGSGVSEGGGGGVPTSTYVTLALVATACVVLGLYAIVTRTRSWHSRTSLIPVLAEVDGEGDPELVTHSAPPPPYIRGEFATPPMYESPAYAAPPSHQIEV